MINPATSPTVFLSLLLLFVTGAAGSLALRKNNTAANLWSAGFAVAGSLSGLLFAILLIVYKKDLSFALTTGSNPLLHLSFHIDQISAVFIFVISLIALFCSIYSIGYVKHFYGRYNIGTLGFFYNTFILGMLVVVSVDNGLFFLIAWEIMSITSYFLVIYEHREPNNIKAGFLYLVMTHVATAFIILAFLLFFKYTGSFNFRSIQSGVAFIPSSIKNVIFVLALIGFGTKAGIIPFHVWLPGAHPAAPSHVSALMSGVMIKTGIYMMIRFFLDMLQPIPVWWGLTIIVIGSLSSLLGVLFALTEHDLKKLLACHSIENIGIILLGLGSSLTFLSLGMPALSLIGLIAALFHTLNHATFKSLLFLSAGSVINETHTRNMEKYGGLIKRMPQTTFFFLAGSMAISALPPFNGFFSEWMTFQSLFQGITSPCFSVKWVFISSVAALALTGGLALTCFVKAFGTTFLARPRSQDSLHAKESPLSFQIGMGSLAGLSLLFGLFSGPLTSILNGASRTVSVFKSVPSLVSISPFQGIAVSNFSFVSGPALFVVFIAAFCLVLLAVQRIINKNQEIHTGSTWGCGSDLSPRMEITSTGFARSIVTIFKGVLKPSIQHDTEYHDAESRYLPKSRMITLLVKDLHLTYLYKPVNKVITALSLKAKSIQSGNINLYILYIFIALLVALTLVK